jgi:hypothetical protein
LTVEKKLLLATVYGAAQQDFKEAFLSELVQLCPKEILLIIIGGDFNILIRGSNE